MMKQYILIMLFTLAGLAGMAQTNEPLPGDAEPLTNQLYLSPSDSAVWAADPFSGLAIKVGTWFKVDSLFKEGYTKVQVDSAITVNISFQNVKSFGAVGDGVTDDTEAIRDAMAYLKSSGDGRLFFPEGVYMISGTVYVPSDVEIFGDGKEKSIIKNMPDAELDLVIPFGILGNSLDENRAKFLPMWATETTPRTSLDSVRNILIHDLGFDYNGANAGNYSATCLIMGRAYNCHVSDVYFYPTLPSDIIGVQNRGSNMMFAFAEDCSIRNSVFTASDYESLSVRYISKNIRISNNIFDIDKPDIYHTQDHAMQIAPPPPSDAMNTQMIDSFGTITSGPAYLEYNTFLVKRNVNNGITAHATTGFYVHNNYFQSFSTNSSPGNAIKPFDDTHDVIITGNVIDYSVDESSGGQIAIQTNGTVPSFGEDSNYIITDNLIKVTQANASLDTIRPAIGGIVVKTNNVIISNNIIEVHGYRNRGLRLIGVSGDNINVSGNDIKYIDPLHEITELGPTAIYVKESSNVNISDNNVSGDEIAFAVFNDTSESIEREIVSNNIADNSINFINTDHPQQASEIRVSPLTVNGIPSDSEGNIELTGLFRTSYGSPQGSDTFTGDMLTLPEGSYSAAISSLASNRPHVAATGGYLSFGQTTGGVQGRFVSARTGIDLMLYSTGSVSNPWYRIASREFLQNNSEIPIQSTQFRLSSLNTPPASATATGTAGEIRFGTDGRIYICTGTNTWIRSEPLTTW